MSDLAEMIVSAGWDGQDAEAGLDRLGVKFDSTAKRFRDMSGQFVSFSSAQKTAAQATLEHAQLTGQLTGELEKGAGAVRNYGIALTGLITLPVAGALATIINVGSQTESSLNRLKGIAHATAEEMAAVSAKARELGADLSLPNTSAKDAANAMLELRKGGLSLKDAMEAARGTIQLSKAAMMDEAEAAIHVSDALNTFQLSGSQAARVADLLTGASSNASGTVGQMAEALAQTGAVAKGAKLSIEDTVTAISLLAKNGIKGSDAGTSIKTFLLALQTPVSRDAEKALKTMKISAYDANKELRPLPVLLDQFKGAMAGLTDKSQASFLKEVFGTDAIRAARILFGEGSAGFDKMRAAVSRSGQAEEQAKAATEGLAGAWGGLTSVIETFAIDLYDKIKTPLTRIVVAMSETAAVLADVWNSLAPSTQAAIAGVVAFAAALGPVLVVAGTVAGAFLALMGAIGGIGVASAIAVAAGTTLVAALAPVAVVALQIIGVATALGLALAAASGLAAAAWVTDFGGIRETTYAVFNYIEGFVGSVLASVLSIAQSMLPTLESLWSKVVKSISALWEAGLKNIVGVLKGTFDVLASVFKAIVEIVGGAIDLVLQLIDNDWAGAWETFKKILLATVGGVSGILGGLTTIVWAILKGVAQLVWAGIKLIAEGLWSLGKAIVEGIVAAIKAAPGAITDGLKYLFTNALSDLGGWLVEKGANIWHAVQDGFTGAARAKPLDIGLPKIEATSASVGANTANTVAANPPGADAAANVLKTGKKDIDFNAKEPKKTKEKDKSPQQQFRDSLNEWAQDWKVPTSALREIGAKTGHNHGSKHGAGLATDISPQFMSMAAANDAKERGLRVLDERNGPSKPGAKWTGAHWHVEWQGKAGKSQEKFAEATSKAEVDLAQTAASAIERVQAKRIADDEYFYSTGKKAFADFANTRRSASDAMYNAQMATLQKEQKTLNASGTFGKEREAAQAQLNEKIAALQQKHQGELTQIDRDEAATKLSIARTNASSLLSLMEEQGSAATAIALRMADQGVRTYKQAQDEISKIQLAILVEQKKGIEGDLALAPQGSDAAAQLTGQLNLINAKIKNARAQALADGVEADAKDIARARDHADQLRGVWDSIADMERQTQQSRIDILKSTGDHEEEVWKKELDLAISTENVMQQRRVEDLKRRRKVIEESIGDENWKRDQITAINAQIGAEERASNQRRDTALEDYYAKQNEKLKGYAEKAVGVLGNALKGFKEDGWRGFFKSIGNDFLGLLTKMSGDLLKSKLLKLLQSIHKVPSAETSVTKNGGDEKTGGLDIGSFLGGVINSIFHHGSQGATTAAPQDTTSGAVTQAGVAAVGAVKGAGDANTQAIDATGKKTAFSLSGISQNLIQGLAGIANMIAVSNTRGGFWKGLLGAAASGAISGALGAVHFGGGSGASGGDSGSSAAPGHAVGGFIAGQGTATSDSILSRLSNGEFVIKASSVAALGKHNLDFINQFGKLPAFATGGFIGSDNYVPPVNSAGLSSNRAPQKNVTIHFKQEIHTPDAASFQRSARQNARAMRGALATEIR